jgi:hypothetical protein
MAPVDEFLSALEGAAHELYLFGHKRLAAELMYVVEYHKHGADNTCLICVTRYPCASLKHLGLGLNVNWSVFLPERTERDCE